MLIKPDSQYIRVLFFFAGTQVAFFKSTSKDMRGAIVVKEYSNKESSSTCGVFSPSTGFVLLLSVLL